MRPNMTRWQKVRRALAHQSFCPEHLQKDDTVCDLDWGHQGLHIHYGYKGVWVWSTDKNILGWIEYTKQ